MTVRPGTAFRRAFESMQGTAGLGGPAPAGAAAVFTQGFLNASLLQLAICSPPRAAAATRTYSEIYITEPGEKAVRRPVSV